MALESAKAKLEGKFAFENLPADRSDVLWDKIEASFSLTLEELSALKNERCKPQGYPEGAQGAQGYPAGAQGEQGYPAGAQGYLTRARGVSRSDEITLASKLGEDIPVSGVTLLATLVGNQGTSLQEAFKAIKVLSDARGAASLNKERTPIPATFGPGGHGKTHLCRSLTSELPQFLRSECKINHPICFLVSFNQTSTWQSVETPVAAVWTRCVKSLGLPVDFCLPPATFREMLICIRNAVIIARHCRAEDVGLCFLIDEIMKVPLSPRRELLNELTSAMQDNLASNLPTFMLVTSLEVDPVHAVIQTQSRRPLAVVLLHSMSEDDKRAIVDSVYEILCACLEACVPPQKFNEAKGKQFAYRFLEFNIFHATPHYRTIEDVVLKILSHFIPANFASISKKRKNGDSYAKILSHPEFPKMNTLPQIEAVLAVWCDEKQRPPPVMPVPIAHLEPQELQLLTYIFAQNVLFREAWHTEAACRTLLDKDVLVVRKRDSENIFRISVVANLPYLLKHASEYPDVSQPVLFSEHCIWSALGALEGILTTSLRDAPDRYEDLVPVLFLLRASASLTLNPKITDIPIELLLPDALVNFNGRLFFCVPTRPCVLIQRSTLRTASALEAARQLITETQLGTAIFVMEGDRALDSIEGATGHFAVRKSDGTQEFVTVGITAKLRIPGKDTPRGAQLARNALTTLDVPGLGLLALSCYAEDSSIQLPERSIVLGVNAVRSLLSPFGVSYMLSIVEKKASGKS